MKKKKLSKKELQKRNREAVAKWYSKHGTSYNAMYRRRNPEKIREIFQRYRNSSKGKRAVKRYEQKPHRKAAKAFWNFKKNLERKVEEGLISEYEMKKLIKHRLEEKPI